MSDSWSDSEPDDEEASPKVEVLFQQAFAEADPAPSLLKVVDEHPTYEDIEFPLIEYYVEAVEKNPSRGQVLTSALAKLETLSADIGGQLDRAVIFKIFFNEEAKDYGPTNKFLLHSLLSGLSFKHQLVHNSSMYAAIEGGLDPSACQSGFHSVDQRCGPRYRRSAELVAKNLKDRKASGVVKDPHAIQVLELAILHAESGLKPEKDRDDVWDLLFPSKS